MSEPFIAMIVQFGGNFAPRGWAFCQGQLLSIAQNTALFSLLGTTFGGNGQTTFGLPDLRGRYMRGTGQGPGLGSVDLGEMSGTETVTMTQGQMPQHTHVFTGTGSTLKAATPKATLQIPDGNMLARSVDNSGVGSTPRIYAPAATTPTTDLAGLNVAGTNSIAGGSQPLPILDPYLGMNHIIAIEGIFPSRN